MSASTGEATRSKLDVNIATPAIDMTVRYGEVNILLMHQTFGGTPQFSVAKTSQTGSQNIPFQVEQLHTKHLRGRLRETVSEGIHKHRTPLPAVKRDVVHVVKV